MSSIHFKTVRGSSGVDLRLHPRECLLKLSQDQKDDLQKWERTDEGKKQNKLNFKSDESKKGRHQTRKAHNESGGGD